MIETNIVKHWWKNVNFWCLLQLNKFIHILKAVRVFNELLINIINIFIAQKLLIISISKIFFIII